MNSYVAEFYPQLLQKGYTEREVRQEAKRDDSREVPDPFKSKYETYEEYLEALHDFMNGI